MITFLNKIFLKSYETESIELQKKAQALVIASLTMLFLLPVSTIMEMLTTQRVIIAVLTLVITVLFIIPLILVRKKKYTIANTFVTLLFLLGLAFLVFANDALIERAEIYRYNTVLLFGMFLIYLISNTYRQLILYGAGGCISMIIFTIYMVEKGTWINDAVTQKEIISAVLMTIFAAGLAAFALSISKQRIKYSKEEANKNAEKFNRIQTLLESSKTGMNIGSKLTGSTARTANQIEEIGVNLMDIKGKIQFLKEAASSSGGANSNIVEFTRGMNSNIDEYKMTVAQASSAIEEMTASINNISTISKAKKESIQQLVDTTKEGEEEMTEAANSIKTISNQASNVFEIIDVITSIASQTDLLAMNAAIEAAHAGIYGKGFAVVAEEIRKLAELSDENITIVTETLKKYFDDIQRAADINKKAADTFHRINQDVKQVRESIEEIIAGMQEVALGTQDITRVVTSVVTMSKDIGDSTSNVEKMVENSNAGIEVINHKINDITSEIGIISAKFEDIKDEAQQISVLGRENVSHMETMDTKLKEIT